ncbi:glycosyltransferase family protein [Pararhizobium mangrovi]|uniref:Uncharacterized protein n=1 Tax=Pararhizobium mangrovi TaxID=2590452 RepID=A0A506TWL4_9HYPH|nr:glycosyltransferase family 2 protein [Pararhizobium mangrovi]TPW25880.1 hypothetical protein FJU11_17275 [Pararhizobium mangrovi]
MVSKVRLVTCVGVDFDLDILPHFLSHYLELGIPARQIHVTLQSTCSRNPRLVEAQEILKSFGVSCPDIWVAPYTSETMWQRRRALQEKVGEPEDWILSADTDEFHEYPGELLSFLTRCEKRGINCVQGVFVDHLAEGGRLKAVRRTPTIWKQYPLEADVIFTLAGNGQFHSRGGTVKLMAFKGHIFPSRGGHRPVDGQRNVRHFYGDALGAFRLIETPAYRFAIPLRVHHFHWTATLEDRLRRRIATPGVSEAGSEYGGKLLSHIDTFGAINLDNVALASEHKRKRFRTRPSMMRSKSAMRGLERCVRHFFKGPKT